MVARSRPHYRSLAMHHPYRTLLSPIHHTGGTVRVVLEMKGIYVITPFILVATVFTRIPHIHSLLSHIPPAWKRRPHAFKAVLIGRKLRNSIYNTYSYIIRQHIHTQELHYTQNFNVNVTIMSLLILFISPLLLVQCL